MNDFGYDNRLTLQKLEVFCLVVELGSMSRAAERLIVAQPVVTGHVQSLQKRLGVELLYRSGRRLKLTEAGERVYEWARETLARTRSLTRELGGLADGEGGGIVVAASTTLGSYVLPEILTSFRERYPGAHITLSVLDPEQTIDAVEGSECDFAVVATGTPPQSRVLATERIGAERIVLVAAPDFLPEIDAVSLEDLSEMPLVSLPAGGVRRRVTDSELDRHGVRLRNIVMELGHPESMKRATRDGLGMCLLFRSAARRELESGELREVAIIGSELVVPILTVLRSDKRLSPIQQRLVEAVRRDLPTLDAPFGPIMTTDSAPEGQELRPPLGIGWEARRSHRH